MRIKNMQRVATVAGLALCGALAFGGLAQASADPAPASGTSVSHSASQEPAGRLGVKGPVTGLSTKVINGHKVLVMEMGGGKHTVNWAVTAKTKVTKHGKRVPPRAIKVGDIVTAEGKVPGPGLPPKGAVIAASSVAIQ